MYVCRYRTINVVFGTWILWVVHDKYPLARFIGGMVPAPSIRQKPARFLSRSLTDSDAIVNSRYQACTYVKSIQERSLGLGLDRAEPSWELGTYVHKFVKERKLCT